jgi:hypothetical protein
MNDQKLFEYAVTASVREATDSDFEELKESSAQKEYELAAADPVVDGKPRMLMLTAWIAHEKKNLNNQVFIKEELKARVIQGLFAPPHAGMIDFDHDYEPRGFWYKASMAYDTKAERWGIIASGAVWAWRFPEFANLILAEMQRSGSIPVSMAARAESIEFVDDEESGYPAMILHNPIFFTTSILDIPPADPHARAVAKEDATEPLDAPAQKALQANAHTGGDGDTPSSDPPTQEDVVMDKDLKELSQDLQTVTEAKVTAETQVTELTQKLDEANEKIAGFEGQIEILNAKVAELEVALQSASETKTQLEGDLEEVRAQLKKFEEEKAAAEKAERLEARISELPEVVRKNLEEHDDCEAIKASWSDVTDEQWETIKQTFDLSVVTGPDYVDRTDKQGKILTATGVSDKSGLKQFIQ